MSEQIQRASTVAGGIPYRSARVLFVRVTPSGGVSIANTITGKRDLLNVLGPGDVAIACWPGQYRQDAFLIDEVEFTLAALT